MIKFKEIRYKNFLSSGDNFTSIQFDKTSTTLIVGQNGAGKSTMLDALSFALFGKAHRNINKNQLINSINGKGCQVEVEFVALGHQFKVIRGIKPTKFEIWQEDKLINQDSHARDYQKFLEQNILKLNHKSFHQIVVLGSSSFTPFMQLPAQHRREVIEDLLDINVFSKMNSLLKERVTVLREKITANDHELTLVQTKIDAAKNHIAELEKISESARQEKTVELDEAESELARLEKLLDDSIAETFAELEKEFSIEAQYIELENTLNEYAFAFEPETTEVINALIEYNEI